MPGYPLDRRYISVPQTEQKLFSIELPVAIVLSCLKRVSLSSPRKCLRCVSATTKLEANMEAVILRQSVQWQRNVSTRPSPEVG